jgi:hypothetical protein
VSAKFRVSTVKLSQDGEITKEVVGCVSAWYSFSKGDPENLLKLRQVFFTENSCMNCLKEGRFPVVYLVEDLSVTEKDIKRGYFPEEKLGEAEASE